MEKGQEAHKGGTKKKKGSITSRALYQYVAARKLSQQTIEEEQKVKHGEVRSKRGFTLTDEGRPIKIFGVKLSRDGSEEPISRDGLLRVISTLPQRWERRRYRAVIPILH